MSQPQSNRRWYRLTPDRAVLGLLAVEGLFLLSERFRWFAFNQHKGWTVLIAAATIAVALLLLGLWFLAALVFRLRFQFSLLTLFVLTSLRPSHAVGWRPRCSRPSASERPSKQSLAGVPFMMIAPKSPMDLPTKTGSDPLVQRTSRTGSRG